jgi:hypothetical protein
MAVGVLIWLGLVSSAGAATVTIGGVAPGPSGTECGGCTNLQVSTDSASPSYMVPPVPASGNPWTLTSWSVQGEAMDGTARLLVWRRTATPGEFQLLADTPDQVVPANTAPSFAVSIPVQPRDVIGIRSGSHIDPSFDTPFANDVVMAAPGLLNPTVGLTVGAVTSDNPGMLDNGSRVNVSATVTSPDPPLAQQPNTGRQTKKCKRKHKQKRAAEAKKKKKCKRRKKHKH